MERAAVETELEVDDLKKAEYMVDKIGEEYTGIISSVTSFGLFVELENTVEGLVHVSYMTDDYYHFSDRHHALIGERSEEHTSELQSRGHLVCRLLLEKKKYTKK